MASNSGYGASNAQRDEHDGTTKPTTSTNAEITLPLRTDIKSLTEYFEAACSSYRAHETQIGMGAYIFIQRRSKVNPDTEEDTQDLRREILGCIIWRHLPIARRSFLNLNAGNTKNKKY